MRLTFGIVLLAFALYVSGASIVSAHAGHVRHVWHGEGSSTTISFSMPAGPLPGVLTHPWTFTYHLVCHGLKPIPGGPPDTYAQPTLYYSLNGNGSFGGSSGISGEDSLGHSTMSWHFGDGGSYTLTIKARPTCAWTVTATS